MTSKILAVKKTNIETGDRVQDDLTSFIAKYLNTAIFDALEWTRLSAYRANISVITTAKGQKKLFHIRRSKTDIDYININDCCFVPQSPILLDRSQLEYRTSIICRELVAKLQEMLRIWDGGKQSCELEIEFRNAQLHDVKIHQYPEVNLKCRFSNG